MGTTMNRLLSKGLDVIQRFIVKAKQKQTLLSTISLILIVLCVCTLPVHARKHVNTPIYEKTSFSANFPKTFVYYKGQLFKTEMIAVSSPQDETDTTHVAVRWFMKSIDRGKGQNIYAQVGIKLDQDFSFTDEWLIPVKDGKGNGTITKKMEGMSSTALDGKDLYVKAKAHVDFSNGGMCSVKFRIKKM